MADFFAMGGYAAFVWPSFGVTAVVLAAVWLASVRGLRARQAELDALQRHAGQRGAGEGNDGGAE